MTEDASESSRDNEVRTLWIPGPIGRLEGRLRIADRPRATAVVAHPHPLHGGTLHNPVVFHADRELHRRGLSTLRFNFRGVGDSDGRHDDGRGEIEDVAAAADWLRGVGRACPMFLVGFSFGSLCSLRLALRRPAIAGVVAIGYPVRRYALPEVADLGRPLAVVQASDDEFGTPDEVATATAGASPPATIHVVDGTTHLFPGRANEAGTLVAGAVEDWLTATGAPDRDDQPTRSRSR